MGNKVSVTVIATGFAKEEENTKKVEETVAVKDDNVMDLDTFSSVLKGKPLFASQNTEPLSGFGTTSDESQDEMISEKVSSIGNLKNILSQSDYYDEDIVKTAISESSVLKQTVQQPHNMQPPAGYKVNNGDISQPAFWRQKGNLSSSINLSDDF